MSNIQVKNVPPDLHEALRELARRDGITLGELMLQTLERRLRHERFLALLRNQEPLGEPLSVLAALQEARAERDSELVDRAR